MQLTEYLTGLNARIGIPNEHLSGDHNEELAMPMYSTCIGLILKGYNDYENKNKQMAGNFVEVLVSDEEPTEVEDDSTGTGRKINQVEVTGRKTIKDLMNSFKTNLLELFKEEGDTSF